MKVEQMQESLLFSQREKLGREVEKWMAEHNVKNNPASTVAFLAKIGLLNVERCKEYIETPIDCKVCGGTACICNDGPECWAAHCMDCNNSTGERGCYDPLHRSQKEAVHAWNKLNQGD